MQIIGIGDPVLQILIFTSRVCVHTGHPSLTPKYPPGVSTYPLDLRPPALRPSLGISARSNLETIMSDMTRSAGATVSTLLGTIGSAATMVAKTIDSAASSVDMLDRFVQRAKDHQRDQHLVEDRHWRRNLIIDAGNAQQKIEANLVNEYAGDPAAQQRFKTIVADLESLFD